MSVDSKDAADYPCFHIVMLCDIICHQSMEIFAVFDKEEDAVNCAKDEQKMGCVPQIYHTKPAIFGKLNQEQVAKVARSLTEIYFVYTKTVRESNKKCDLGKITDIRAFIKLRRAERAQKKGIADGDGKIVDQRVTTKQIQRSYIQDPY